MSKNKPPRTFRGSSPRSFRQITGVVQDQAMLPFVIPDLTRDAEKGLCITVEMGRTSTEPFVAEFYRVACGYFEEVRDLFIAGEAGNLRAIDLAHRRLSFKEAREIRFGYTATGHDGNGVGKDDLSRSVFEYFLRYPELRAACAVHPDAMQLIPMIGMDRVSDAMASITKEVLILFTQHCARFFRFDPACMKQVKVTGVWLETEGRVGSKMAVLPVDDDGMPILLVPTALVRSGPALDAGGYSNDLPPSDGPPSPKAPKLTKGEVLDDAEAHPGRLNGYAEDRLKKVGPRREFGFRRRSS